MTSLGVSGAALALVLMLSAAGVPIGVAMGSIGLAGLWFVAGEHFATTVLQTLPYNAAGQYAFVVVPMFVLMGAITSESGATKNLLAFSDRLMSGFRGSLLHATTVASAGFAAISGSTVVNAALFTKIALPQMAQLGYNKAFAAGCIAAAGTLAALIPPSLSFVIYGILTSEPIGQLLIAGIVPGIITAIAYIAVIALGVKLNPRLAPVSVGRIIWRERFEGLGRLWPILTLAFIVIGGIYTGFMTPSSAGAVGAFGALVIALLQRQLSLRQFRNSLESTVAMTSALFMIVIGGLIFSRFLLVSGALGEMSSLITGSGVSAWMFLLGIVLIYFVLGMFMDPMSMLVMTLPFLYPVVKEFGLDGIWFGVIVVKLVEIAVITPPVGMNLFAVVSASEGQLKIIEIFRGVWPFVIAELVVLALLMAFPAISRTLPGMM